MSAGRPAGRTGNALVCLFAPDASEHTPGELSENINTAAHKTAGLACDMADGLTIEQVQSTTQHELMDFAAWYP